MVWWWSAIGSGGGGMTRYDKWAVLYEYKYDNNIVMGIA